MERRAGALMSLDFRMEGRGERVSRSFANGLVLVL